MNEYEEKDGILIRTDVIYCDHTWSTWSKSTRFVHGLILGDKKYDWFDIEVSICDKCKEEKILVPRNP